MPQEPLDFQPRADLLAEVDRAGPGVSVVHAVTGMRGVGKTKTGSRLCASEAGGGLAAPCSASRPWPTWNGSWTPTTPAPSYYRNDFANAYLQAGQTGEAIVLYEQVLAAREPVLGPDHPDTLITRNNLQPPI